MAQLLNPAAAGSAASAAATEHRAAYQAYQILRLGFIVAPIIAGIDKFVQFLTTWDQYLAPALAGLLGAHTHTFLLIVGIIEIAAGLGVAWRPRIFAYVVAGWLVGIVINLILTGQYLDIALRDVGLALGALALARLSPLFDQ